MWAHAFRISDCARAQFLMGVVSLWGYRILADEMSGEPCLATATTPNHAPYLMSSSGTQQLEAAKTTDLDISADRKMSKPKQNRHGKANDCRIYQTRLFIEEKKKF